MSLPIETRGEDWSHYQGVQDYAARAKAERLSFLGIKATEGMTYTDPMHAANKRQCLARGDVPISYHYADPGVGTAAGQAARLVNAARPVAGRDAICLDLERVPLGMTQAGAHAWAVQFGRALRQLAPGVTTIAYLGGYAVNGTGAHLADEFDLWWHPRYATTGPAGPWPTTMEAAPAGNTTGWRYPHMWQWTPNYGGRDADVSVLTTDHLVGVAPLPPAPQPDPVKDEPMFLVSVKGQPDQYVSNGVTRRGVVDVPYRAFLIARGMDTDGGLPFEFDTVSGMNAVAGALAADSPRYDTAAGQWVPPTPPYGPTDVAKAVIAALGSTGQGGDFPTVTELGEEFERRTRTILAGTTLTPGASS